MKNSKRILAKAEKIKLLILDVDGVLTDGRLYYTDRGEEIKAFNVHDGHGIVMMKKAGIKTAIISGRKSKSVRVRARELGVRYVYQGIFDKVRVMEQIIKREKIKRENVCYMGDDVTDIALLLRVGFSVSVMNGAPDVKTVVDYVTTKKGGKGAVREIAEIILKAKGLWEQIINNYK
jgi:3-deoxy-D-manno-octulosonate 8-phosphate phosphatase (KDO 8-P phosphatase)